MAGGPDGQDQPCLGCTDAGSRGARVACAGCECPVPDLKRGAAVERSFAVMELEALSPPKNPTGLVSRCDCFVRSGSRWTRDSLRSRPAARLQSRSQMGKPMVLERCGSNGPVQSWRSIAHSFSANYDQ